MRWLWGTIAVGVLVVIVGVSLWVGLAHTPAVRFLIRLYVDQAFLKAELEAWRGVISSWERDHLLLKV